MRLMIVSAVGSMRTIVPKPPVAAQTLPAPVARSTAGAAIPIVLIVARLTGSTRDTVPSAASPTHTLP